MNATITPITCTDAQKAEWSDLHDRIRDLDKRYERANEMAAYSLRGHVVAGGMTPGEFGLPSEEAVRDYRSACESARDAAEAWAERSALYEAVQAHPYTAEVLARRESRA